MDPEPGSCRTHKIFVYKQEKGAQDKPWLPLSPLSPGQQPLCPSKRGQA